jgi:hypothetical protein
MPNNNNVSKYYKNESRRRRNESLRRRNIKKRLNGTSRSRRPVANGPSPLNPAYKRKNVTVYNIIHGFNSLDFYE